MKHEPLEVIRGSGNVYSDLGQDDADVKQFKALLASVISRFTPEKQGQAHCCCAFCRILSKTTAQS